MPVTIVDHISSAWDFWTKIAQPDYSDFHASPSDLRKASHVSVSLFHVSDWVWGDYKREPQRIFGTATLSDLRKYIVANQCGDFGLIRDIADGSRHFRLDQPTATTRTVYSATDVTVHSTGFGEGRYGEGTFGGAPQIVVNVGSGVRHFSAIAKNVYEMWERLFRERRW